MKPSENYFALLDSLPAGRAGCSRLSGSGWFFLVACCAGSYACRGASRARRAAHVVTAMNSTGCGVVAAEAWWRAMCSEPHVPFAARSQAGFPVDVADCRSSGDAMPRAKRTERQPGVHIRLRTRDEALLRALVRFRAAPTPALVSVAFSSVSRQAATRRLRKLLDAGFLSVAVPGLAAPNVYSLGPEGKRWARLRGLEVGSAPCRLPQHHLATVSTWVAIAAATRELGWGLRQFLPEWELRLRVSTGVVPDGLVQVAVPCPKATVHILRLVLEVDRGTESIPTLRSKFERLALLSSAGGILDGWDDPILALALFGASVRRVADLAQLLQDTWPGRGVQWTDLAGPRLALVSLREAVAPGCCNGNNRHVDGTNSFSSTSETDH